MMQADGSIPLARTSHSVPDLENYFEQAQEVVRTAMHWAVLPRGGRGGSEGCREGVERDKKSRRILEKVQEVHDTDRSKEVGLTEDEQGINNPVREKYPRHVRRTTIERPPRLLLRQRGVSRPGAHVTHPERVQPHRSGFAATPGPTTGCEPLQVSSMEWKLDDRSA